MKSCKFDWFYKRIDGFWISDGRTSNSLNTIGFTSELGEFGAFRSDIHFVEIHWVYKRIGGIPLSCQGGMPDPRIRWIRLVLLANCEVSQPAMGWSRSAKFDWFYKRIGNPRSSPHRGESNTIVAHSLCFPIEFRCGFHGDEIHRRNSAMF